MNFSSPLLRTRARVRPAEDKDRGQLANILHFETHVHRHLDWRPPLDWLGLSPYLIAEQDERVVAALACPPDPPGVAWIRVFAAGGGEGVGTAWELLWPLARQQLGELPVKHVAAIPLQDWFRDLLQNHGFRHAHNVVVLVWDNASEVLPAPRATCDMRPMLAADLAAVQELDAVAFGELWRNSLDSLDLAFKQAAVATVAEDDEGLLGYQISTHSPLGAHLARLAVHPRAQRQGVGYRLVRELQEHYSMPPLTRLTVNTQDHNEVSLALYKKAGFRETQEHYPVYQLDL